MSYRVLSSGIVVLDGETLVLPKASTPGFFAIVDRLRPIVESNAKRTGVPTSWIYGIIWAETGFLGPIKGASAVSPAGAIGRMQLMPFWFTKPTAIGDGKPHTNEEMFDDALNIRFGTDLLKIIMADGNDLPRTSSIYNCGSATAKHPWTPHPSPPWVGRAAWGMCGQLGDDGLSYQDHIAAASNTYLHASPTAAVAVQPSEPQYVEAAAVVVVGGLVLRRLFR